jgi:hypothetical protein
MILVISFDGFVFGQESCSCGILRAKQVSCHKFGAPEKGL